MILVTTHIRFPDNLYKIPQDVQDEGAEAIIEWYEEFGDLSDYETHRTISYE